MQAVDPALGACQVAKDVKLVDNAPTLSLTGTIVT